MKRIPWILIFAILLQACTASPLAVSPANQTPVVGSATNTPIPTDTSTPTVTATFTATSTATITATPTETPVPTPSELMILGQTIQRIEQEAGIIRDPNFTSLYDDGNGFLELNYVGMDAVLSRYQVPVKIMEHYNYLLKGHIGLTLLGVDPRYDHFSDHSDLKKQFDIVQAWVMNAKEHPKTGSTRIRIKDSLTGQEVDVEAEGISITIMPKDQFLAFHESIKQNNITFIQMFGSGLTSIDDRADAMIVEEQGHEGNIRKFLKIYGYINDNARGRNAEEYGHWTLEKFISEYQKNPTKYTKAMIFDFLNLKFNRLSTLLYYSLIFKSGTFNYGITETDIIAQSDYIGKVCGGVNLDYPSEVCGDDVEAYIDLK